MIPSPYQVDFSAREGDKVLASETFTHRWSPHSFDSSVLTQDTLNTIFDAVRFSPSAFNAQPWRIFSSQADRSDLNRFLELLVDRNQAWARSASALGFIIALKDVPHNNQENLWALYDCGFAWAAMTFQANQLGLYAHGMAGIKSDEVYTEFGIDHQEKPSLRKALDEIYFPGGSPLV